MDIEAELSKFQPGSKERILLEKVLDKLAPNFARKSLLAKAKEVCLKRDEAMQKYFEREIVKDAINKSVVEQEQELEFARKVHPFHLEEARKFLPKDEASEISRFCGLTQKDIPQTSKLEDVAFQKLVSEKLKEFLNTIVEYSRGTVKENDWKNSVDESLKNIQSKIDIYVSAKKDALNSRKELKDAIDVYDKKLTKCLTLLTKLVELHQDHLDFGAIVSEQYKLHCCALAKKTEHLHLKLSLDTYNLKTLPALNHISSELNIEEETLKKKKQELIDTFEKYSQLGEVYESIVDEILTLGKKIEKEQHAIDGLRSLNPFSPKSDISDTE